MGVAWRVPGRGRRRRLTGRRACRWERCREGRRRFRTWRCSGSSRRGGRGTRWRGCRRGDGVRARWSGSAPAVGRSRPTSVRSAIRSSWGGGTVPALRPVRRRRQKRGTACVRCGRDRRSGLPRSVRRVARSRAGRVRDRHGRRQPRGAAERRPGHSTTKRPAEASTAARSVSSVAWRSTQAGERSSKASVISRATWAAARSRFRVGWSRPRVRPQPLAGRAGLGYPGDEGDQPRGACLAQEGDQRRRWRGGGEAVGIEVGLAFLDDSHGDTLHHLRDTRRDAAGTGAR